MCHVKHSAMLASAMMTSGMMHSELMTSVNMTSATKPRSHGKRLRERSNGDRLQLRERESEVETLQRQLFAERLQRLDLVIDHDAVPFNAALLDDDDALEEHIEGLLADKPYLRKRKVSGNIGQHSSNGVGGSSVSLMDKLRHNAS